MKVLINVSRENALKRLENVWFIFNFLNLSRDFGTILGIILFFKEKIFVCFFFYFFLILKIFLNLLKYFSASRARTFTL